MTDVDQGLDCFSAPPGASLVRASDFAARSKFALSIDVEDYFQVWAFSGVVARNSWDGFALRVVATTRRVLDLLTNYDAKATFFTLGWVAERAPDLMREIVARGHELASHGYDHKKVFEQTSDEFREDAGRTKAILEDITGLPIRGYRAPGFSIDKRTPWAYEILDGLGYRYSSSAHPIAHDHYGDPGGERSVYRPMASSAFCEAPIATTEFFGRRMSCGGGGWFRASPYSFSKRMIDRASATLNGPVIFYFHPWELDPKQPRIRSAPLKSRFRHYVNIATMETKLGRLLSDYPWGRVDEALIRSGMRKTG